jgi:predicted nucleic-acid-binding protein
MKYFIDTNVFLRFLVADDVRSYECCKEFLEAVEGKRFKASTSSLVFAEMAWVLQSFYQFPRTKISEALNLLAHKGLIFDDRFDLLRAIGLYQSHGIKFVDALLGSNPLIRERKMNIVSYDADFDKLNIKRVEPQEVLRKFSK